MRVALLAALCLLATAAAHAASAADAALTPEAPRVAWEGEHTALAAMPLGEACMASTCEAFTFTVDLPDEMDPPYPGLAVRIAWPSADDNYDLYLYDAWGFPFTPATSVGTTSETLVVEEIKEGSYTAVVVPAWVVDSAYGGSAELLPPAWDGP